MCSFTCLYALNVFEEEIVEVALALSGIQELQHLIGSVDLLGDAGGMARSAEGEAEQCVGEGFISGRSV